MKYLLLLFLLMIHILINFKISKYLITPSNLLCLTWFSFILLHFLFAQDYYYSLRTSIYIYTFILSFNLGEYFSFLTHGKIVRKVNKVSIGFLRSLKIVFFIGFIFSLVGSVLYFFAVLNYFGSFELFAAADIRSEITSIPVPFYIKLMRLGVYPTLFLGATSFILTGRVKYAILPIIPSLISGSVQSGRAGTLMGFVVVFFAFYWRDVYVCIQQEKPLFITLIKLMKKSAILIVCAISFFIFGFMIRIRSFDLSNLSEQLNIFKAYLLGGISAFESQLRYPEFKELYYGKFNFSSFFDMLGIAKNDFGVYIKYYPIKPSSTSIYDYTNIFTAFRPVMDDFGYLGGMFYLLVVGFLFGNFFIKSISGNIQYYPLLMLCYTYLFHSTLLPITVHTSILFSFFIPLIMINVLLKFNRNSL